MDPGLSYLEVLQISVLKKKGLRDLIRPVETFRTRLGVCSARRCQAVTPPVALSAVFHHSPSFSTLAVSSSFFAAEIHKRGTKFSRRLFSRVTVPPPASSFLSRQRWLEGR